MSASITSICVAFPAASMTFTNEVGRAMLGALKKAGYDAVAIRDGDDSFLESDVLVMLGHCLQFRSIARRLRAAQRRPITALWQMESLPPPFLSNEAIAAGMEAGRTQARMQLGEGNLIGVVRRLMPQSVRSCVKQFVLRGPIRKVGVESPSVAEDFHLMLRRFSSVLWIQEGTEQGWLDHVMVSTPESRMFLEGVGIACELLPVAYDPSLGRDLGLERDIDVLFLGTVTQRRGETLALVEKSLQRHGYRLTVIEDGYHGEERIALLNRTKILLSVNREGSWEFPRMRPIMGAACGALTVAEPVADIAPFIPGENIVVAPPDELGDVAARYLSSDSQRQRIVGAARRLLEDELSMSTITARMLESWNLKSPASRDGQ